MYTYKLSAEEWQQDNNNSKKVEFILFIPYFEFVSILASWIALACQMNDAILSKEKMLHI